MRPPAQTGVEAMHRAARAIRAAGRPAAIGFGLLAMASDVPAQSPAPQPVPPGVLVGGAGIALTLAMYILPTFLQWLSAEREKDRKERSWHLKYDRAMKRLGVLEGVSRSNTVKGAGTEGKADATVEAMVARRPLAPPRGVGSAGSTVLVVEDDPQQMRLMAKLFTAWGWSVHYVATVAEAIVEAAREYHWIVLDLKLSEPGDGLEVLRYVRDHGIPTRVCVLTGAADPAVLDACRAAGPDVLLAKGPDVADRLREEVRADLPRPTPGPPIEGGEGGP